MIYHVAIYYWYSYTVEYILNSILNAVLYKKLKLVTSQLGWYDVLPTVTRRP
jgi:hypothetical protein